MTMNGLFVIFLVIGGVFTLEHHVDMMAEQECKYFEYAMVFHNAKGYNTSEYMHKKTVAMKLMQAAGMSYMYNRAGTAVYNGDQEMALYCNQMMSMESAMEDDSYMMNDGEVNWDMALEKGMHLLMGNGCGERPDVFSKVIYLFLNGEDFIPSADMEAAANDLQTQNIKIIIVVINPSQEAYNYLVKIAGEEGMVYNVPSMKHVAENEMMIEMMVEPICKHKDAAIMMPKCDAHESMYPALMMDKYEISKYPGNCTEDKIKHAIEMVKVQMEKMHNQTMDFKETRTYLQMHVLNQTYTMADLTFGQVNHCTMMIECQLPGWMEMLQKKLNSMKNQIYIMQGGWKSYLLQKLYQENH